MTLTEFLESVQRDSSGVLGLSPLLRFREEGGVLSPGQLLNVDPPLCTAEASNGVSLAAVPTLERLAFLADLAEKLETVEDGQQIEIDV